MIFHTYDVHALFSGSKYRQILKWIIFLQVSLLLIIIEGLPKDHSVFTCFYIGKLYKIDHLKI